MQSIAGLNTLVALFFFNVTHRSNAVYGCLHLGTRTELYIKVISREAMREMKSILSKLLAGQYPSITHQLQFWHPGGAILSSDASSSFDNPKSGWGVRVKVTLLGNPCSDTTSMALHYGTVSTNPLDLLAVARLFLAIMTTGKIPVEFRTMVIRVDNASACACINMDRALSQNIRRALIIIVNIQE